MSLLDWSLRRFLKSLKWRWGWYIKCWHPACGHWFPQRGAHAHDPECSWSNPKWWNDLAEMKAARRSSK